MNKIALRFLPLLAAISSMAQAVTTEAPTEKASPLMVVAFLLVFVGGCAAYFIYLWLNHRKHPKGDGN